MSTAIKKVPVIMQMENLECGAASLAMVLAYYDKWLPLEQVRRDCGVSRDGSNAKNILKAARSYGLEAKGYRYDIEHLKTEVTFPCVLFWGFNHFVVLCGFKKDGAVINDPAKGRTTVDFDTLNTQFTGICLQFSPTEAFETGGHPPSIKAFAMKRLQGTRNILIFMLLIGMMTTFVDILNPVFSRVFLDEILSGNNPNWLLPFILLLTVIVLLQLFIYGVGALNDFRIKGKLAISANTTFMWHLLHLPINFYAQRMTGDIAGRQSANEGIAANLIDLFAPLLINFCMLLFYLFIMFEYSPWLTLIGVGAVIINLFVSQYVAHRRMNMTRVMMRDKSQLTSSTVGALEMIESIKASGSEDGYFEQWSGIQATVNASVVKTNALTAWMGTLPELLFRTANMAVLVLGVFLILNGHFTAGMLAAFQSFMSAFISPARKLLTTGQTFQEMRASMERVEDVFNYPCDAVHTSVAAEAIYTPLSGHIDITDLTFGYAPLGEPLITDFSLHLKPGQRIALVGASGCGKSTIARLISGLYSPWKGCIKFDDKPREAFSHEVLTGSIAVVDQEIVLFEDTIMNNITLWDDTIPEQQITAAARDACLHDVITRREGAYNSLVLEGGRNFSGGQRQCIEIARAFVQQPSILLLDEATSSLDATTEKRIMEAVTKRGLTCIIAAHRLSTIRDCDEIIVMSHGQIIERGTHATLYAKGGAYTQLIAEE